MIPLLGDCRSYRAGQSVSEITRDYTKTRYRVLVDRGHAAWRNGRVAELPGPGRRIVFGRLLLLTVFVQ